MIWPTLPHVCRFVVFEWADGYTSKVCFRCSPYKMVHWQRWATSDLPDRPKITGSDAWPTEEGEE